MVMEKEKKVGGDTKRKSRHLLIFLSCNYNRGKNCQTKAHGVEISIRRKDFRGKTGSKFNRM